MYADAEGNVVMLMQETQVGWLERGAAPQEIPMETEAIRRAMIEARLSLRLERLPAQEPKPERQPAPSVAPPPPANPEPILKPPAPGPNLGR